MNMEETEERELLPEEEDAELESGGGDDLSEPSTESEAAETGSAKSGWRGMMVGIGIGVAIAVGGMQFLNKPAQTEPNPSAAGTELAATEPVASQTVTVATVETTTVARTLNATGTVQAYDLLPILPQATGLQIQQVLVDEGDRVKAGQVLAILDDELERSQIAEADTQVDSAKSSLMDRQAGVNQAEGSVFRAEAAQSEAESAVSQAEAAKAEAEAGLQQAIASKAEATAAVSQAQAALAETEAGREQAIANLAKAKADREQADRELERYQQLADAGAISQQELDNRRTAAENAREAVRVAEANIKSAEARIESAKANIASMEARVSSADSNVSSAKARVSSANSNISSAKARLESAIANVRISRSQLTSARANAESAAANVRSTQIRVQQMETQQDRTLVRAPEAGIIAERIARVGDVTSNSNKLFSIIANGELELHVKVPETQLPLVKTGAPVMVSSDADNRIQVRGVVREIAPLVDQQSRQATVKVRLPSDSILKPGMFLQAAITTSNAPALTVPAKAVLPEGEGDAIVYRLVGEDKVQAQKVEVGEVAAESATDLNNARVEIKSGLNVGDRVVVEGAAYLKDGDRVLIADEQSVIPKTEL